MLQTIQIGINTADLPGSLRLYNEGFGFHNAGAQAAWGPAMQIQGLTPDARTLVWWMTGRQPRFQLELFHHTEPQQRLQPIDWRPCDHGWVRIGIALPDLDRALTYLAGIGVTPISSVATIGGVRSCAVRDPYAGVVLELIQDGPELAERVGITPGDGPAVVYVTSSVSDLASARRFYGETVGYDISPLESLHTPEHEHLWGLPGAGRTGFLARSDEIALEIVEYSSPVGRPRPADHLISDQGIMNVAVGARKPVEIAEILDRAEKDGLHSPFVVDASGLYGGYLVAPERELELACIPEELDAFLGFPAEPIPFLGGQLA